MSLWSVRPEPDAADAGALALLADHDVEAEVVDARRRRAPRGRPCRGSRARRPPRRPRAARCRRAPTRCVVRRRPRLLERSAGSSSRKASCSSSNRSRRMGPVSPRHAPIAQFSPMVTALARRGAGDLVSNPGRRQHVRVGRRSGRRPPGAAIASVSTSVRVADPATATKPASAASARTQRADRARRARRPPRRWARHARARAARRRDGGARRRPVSGCSAHARRPCPRSRSGRSRIVVPTRIPRTAAACGWNSRASRRGRRW